MTHTHPRTAALVRTVWEQMMAAIPDGGHLSDVATIMTEKVWCIYTGWRLSNPGVCQQLAGHLDSPARFFGGQVITVPGDCISAVSTSLKI